MKKEDIEQLVKEEVQKMIMEGVFAGEDLAEELLYLKEDCEQLLEALEKISSVTKEEARKKYPEAFGNARSRIREIQKTFDRILRAKWLQD